jgi:(2Fe-2S) ferredoxin
MSTPARWRAYICCGPNCTQRRSPGLIDTMQREVDQAGLASDVEVMPGGCMKHCDEGPSLAIWPGPVYYEHVDAGRLRRIVREHLAEGRPIPQWFYHERPVRSAPRYTYTPGPLPEAHGAQTPPPRQPKAGPPPRRPRPEVDDFKW